MKKAIFWSGTFFTSKNATLTEIDTGKEVQLKNQNSYKGILFDVDKSTYINTLCIGEHGAAPGKELAEDLGNYVVNLTTTRNADIDKTEAIRYREYLYRCSYPHQTRCPYKNSDS